MSETTEEEPRMRLESRFWGTDPTPLRRTTKRFVGMWTLNPQDGDTYTRLHDQTVWVWHTGWHGPFDDIDTAETAARLMQ